jgi:hypothetical protein
LAEQKGESESQEHHLWLERERLAQIEWRSNKEKDERLKKKIEQV